MKKKLEAELISIAHRILKIHNREDIAQLQQEALNLYQKLSILRFYEEHFEPAKPTIGRAELEIAIENLKIDTPELLDEQLLETNDETSVKETLAYTAIDNIVIASEVEQIIVDKIQEPESKNIEVTKQELDIETDIEVKPSISLEIQEPVLENIEVREQDIETDTEVKPSISEDITFTDHFIIDEKNEHHETIVQETIKEVANPLFNEEQPTLIEQLKPKEQEQTLFADNLFAEVDESFAPKAMNSIQTSFENLFGQTYKDLEFVKADETNEEDIEKPKAKRESKKSKQTIETEDTGLFGAKLVADMYTNTITLGLNDRIAFQIHLFNNSDQDLNRVVSQLNTMNNLDEALDFITNMVKPDYNNWKHKEEYEDRFMALVEKRFS